MVTLDSIIHLLRKKNWFMVIDLKDAYFHITIHPNHRKYLRFIFQNTIYQFRALPFGLLTAPRTFTKCMPPVAAYLHLHKIHVYPYIDDWLVVLPSRHQALRDTKFIFRTLKDLGLSVNAKKSHLIPSRIIDYIGARLESIKGRIFLPPEHMQKIQRAIRKFRPGLHVSARHAQHLLGLMASTTPALAHTHLKMSSFRRV